MKRTTERWAIGIGTLVAAGILALLVVTSGVISVAASEGHWAITEAMLKFSKRRSISTHTLLMDPLELKKDWLVLKGAGHYETGCRPCHGSPELRNPRIAGAMLPPAPYLPPRIVTWKPRELFYIVKHGVKLTGMPSWPSPYRDDEVTAMIAFLVVMPEMSYEQYDALVHGESPAATPPMLEDLAEPSRVPTLIASSCARCHGTDGRGRGEAYPALAAQPAQYIISTLEAYARGTRHSGFMQPIAAALSPDEMREAAAWYNSRPRQPRADVSHDDASNASIARGAAIAISGIPDEGIPACRYCHGPSDWPRNPAYPALASQHADYIVLQLELFKADRRGGAEFAHVMRTIAMRLDTAQMRDVANYYASLTSAEPGR